LNERIRAFLRLEHLFDQAGVMLDRSDPWSSRTAIDAILAIGALIGRIDIKSELVKELERQLAALEHLPQSPHIDTERLETILQHLRANLTALRSADAAFGQTLKGNELLNAVRQRSAIPAGTCDFDLPALRFWLAKPSLERRRDLQEWLDQFKLAREAVEVSVALLRSSATATDELAEQGFFQRSLDPAHQCTLVRVVLDSTSPYFSEISAGKHRFTIRFMEQIQPARRSNQTTDDVPFRLMRCGL